MAYDDALSSVGDDYWTSNYNKLARGVYVVVKRADNHWSRPFSGYAYDTGYTPYFSVDPTVTYIVDMYSMSRINGNDIVVKKCSIRACDASEAEMGADTSGFSWHIYHAAERKFEFSSTYYINSGYSDVTSNIIASATYSIYRHKGYQTGKDYLVLHNNGIYIYGWGNEHSTLLKQVHIKSDYGHQRKYILAHEMGHAFVFQANNETSLGAYTGYNATGTMCEWSSSGSHSIASKEKQSGALNEGWAHFFAASTWNNMSESDCKFKYYKNDIDHDADGTPIDKPTIDCEYPDFQGSYPIIHRQWLNNYCSHDDETYANEWDWLMTFWDLVSEYSYVDYMDVVNMLVGVSGKFSSNETDLYCRLRISASTISPTFDDRFNTKAAYNGVNYYDSNESNCSAY